MCSFLFSGFFLNSCSYRGHPSFHNHRLVLTFFFRGRDSIDPTPAFFSGFFLNSCSCRRALVSAFIAHFSLFSSEGGIFPIPALIWIHFLRLFLNSCSYRALPTIHCRRPLLTFVFLGRDLWNPALLCLVFFLLVLFLVDSALFAIYAFFPNNCSSSRAPTSRLNRPVITFFFRGRDSIDPAPFFSLAFTQYLLLSPWPSFHCHRPVLSFFIRGRDFPNPGPDLDSFSAPFSQFLLLWRTSH